MKKSVYRLMDEKGRVLVPKDLRQRAEMAAGDILKLSMESGRLQISKVDIVEVERQDADTMEAYVNAAVKFMNREKQVALAERLLRLARQEGEKDC